MAGWGRGVVFEREGGEVLPFFRAEAEGAPDADGENGGGEGEGDDGEDDVEVACGEVFEHGGN